MSKSNEGIYVNDILGQLRNGSLEEESKREIIGDIQSRNICNLDVCTEKTIRVCSELFLTGISKVGRFSPGEGKIFTNFQRFITDSFLDSKNNYIAILVGADLTIENLTDNNFITLLNQDIISSCYDMRVEKYYNHIMGFSDHELKKLVSLEEERTIIQDREKIMNLSKRYNEKRK